MSGGEDEADRVTIWIKKDQRVRLFDLQCDFRVHSTWETIQKLIDEHDERVGNGTPREEGVRV